LIRAFLRWPETCDRPSTLSWPGFDPAYGAGVAEALARHG
jgi:hypothetical protein